jgi:hypothetical protein
MIGGSVEGNRKARLDLIKKILAFLEACETR